MYAHVCQEVAGMQAPIFRSVPLRDYFSLRAPSGPLMGTLSGTHVGTPMGHPLFKKEKFRFGEGIHNVTPSGEHLQVHYRGPDIPCFLI